MRPPAAPRQPRRQPEPETPAPRTPAARGATSGARGERSGARGSTSGAGGSTSGAGGRGRAPADAEARAGEPRQRPGAQAPAPAARTSPAGDQPRTGRALARPPFVPTGAQLPDRPQGAASTAVSTGLAARLAEKAAADRRLLLRRLGIAVAVVAFLAGLTWAVLFSPLLALDGERIQIDGVGGHVDAAQVRAAVEPEIGTPLLRVDTAGVADRVASVTAVESAQVARSWPHGLTVTVVPREPVASAPAEGGWVLLDDQGVQVTTVPEAPADLPEVTVPLSTSAETAPALDAVLTVLGSLPTDLLGQVAEAGASSAEHVTLKLADGATVQWGSAEENELKAEVLLVLRQQPAGVYDVSVPRSPTTSG
ncbi:cell division protein FtsQ [Georgenia soli]|uniref:Cell division protein FtsQ n=1 Tax=Georgenia soli TaxID=638953 RepID=A0A2A9EIR1_9MICO|nr:FtsQ-type POTRA domain-containing protein [Georgenia soli]PFG38401.1 cell division protein FtsQ [Georgenia soli]